MSYVEEQDPIYLFTEEEKEKIESALLDKGYGTGSVAPCGSCCGYYADEYHARVKEEDREFFLQLFADKKIDAELTEYGRIKARNSYETQP